MSKTYLTTIELASLIKYDPRYIRSTLKDTAFIEGVHYIRPFGGRKILYVWETIEQDMQQHSESLAPIIPLSAGGICHG